MHPNEIAALARRDEKLAEMKLAKTMLAAHVAEHGLSFCHIQTSGRHLTIAYRPSKRSIIELSTAICHPTDKYDKTLGKFYAACNFAEHKVVMLHMPAGYGSIRNFLNCTFASY